MKKIYNFTEKLKKAPYRGVLSEIAKEQGVTRQSVWRGIFVFENPRLLAILSDKLQERKNQYQESIQKLQSI